MGIKNKQMCEGLLGLMDGWTIKFKNDKEIHWTIKNKVLAGVTDPLRILSLESYLKTSDFVSLNLSRHRPKLN